MIKRTYKAQYDFLFSAFCDVINKREHSGKTLITAVSDVGEPTALLSAT
jgi:hypothetical protein